MSLLTAIRQAFAALLAHKGRSALTSLGIVIGVGAVVALVSAGGGARQKLDERLENSGKNLIIIRPGARSGVGVTDFAPLTPTDAEALDRSLPSLLVGAVPWQVTPRSVTSRTATAHTMVVGTTPGFQRVCNWRLAQGRFFTREDANKTAAVCLLGQTVYRNLFPNGAPAVGERIAIDRLPTTVIGVLGTKGYTPLGTDQDDEIIMPLSTVARRLVGKEQIAMIFATARSATAIDAAKEGIVRVLRQQHRLQAGAPDDFDASSVREVAEFAVVLTATLQILVGVIASIALLAGGIGLMNIMLVSVTERTREIGLRMAVGARPRDVLGQFLLEALVLALAGGVLGLGAGLAAAAGLSLLADWPFVISPVAVVVAFAVTAAVGIFFGYYPAWKASRLDPIEALRYE